LILLICSAAALSACGGGGSSAPVSKYPLDLAISTFGQMPHTYNLSGSLGSDDYTLDLSITPGKQASFHGVQALTETDVGTETKNGAPFRSTSGTDYFLTTPYTQLGAVNDSGLTEIDSGQKPLPEFADTGTSGALDSQKYYSDSSLGSQIATGTRTWSVTALTADTAQFCIQDDDDVGGSPETEIDCYDMDIKGNVTAIEITFESGGQSITFK
jgi:hypothetical protein